jgi:hypothetical protein
VVAAQSDRDDSDHHSFHSAASQSPAEPTSDELRFRDVEEKAVYEHQLTQLQEQLVATMIENQNLSQFFS